MMRSVLSAATRAVAGALLAVAAVMPALAGAVEPLVTPQWLKQHLSESNILVLDVRSAIDGGGAAAFDRGHIPGAVHSDYDKAGWRVTRNGVPFMLPTLPELEKLIGETGIDEDNHVIIVPAGVHATDFGSAARVYWTLKIAGHPAVSILDGGFAAWQAASYPIEAGSRSALPKIFTARLDIRLLAEVSEVEAAEKSGGATLLDGRSASFFAGKERAPAAKAYGHIPGALSLDSANFYDPAANRLRTKAELAAIAEAVPAGPVLSYCNTGHWAATNWFVLSELLGKRDTKLYDGSMVEWTADPRRPVASSRTRWDDVKKTLGFGS